MLDLPRGARMAPPPDQTPFRAETPTPSQGARYGSTVRNPLPVTGEVKAVRTIDCTPTWEGILRVLLAALEQGTGEGRKIALDELTRMAKLADLWVASQGDNPT